MRKLDLDDACVVIRNQDGKVQLKQAVNLTAIGAAHGMRTGVLVGLLAGMLILNPLAGMALGGLAGTGMGALSGSLVDFGINDRLHQEPGPNPSKRVLGSVCPSEKLDCRQSPTRDRAI